MERKTIPAKQLGLNEVIKSELGWCYDFISEEESFKNHFKQYLGDGEVPYYEISSKSFENLKECLEEYLETLTKTVVEFLRSSEIDDIKSIYKTNTISDKELEVLISIAKSQVSYVDLKSLMKQSFYGRFDVAINNDGSFSKVYEYNSDTPTMLFESVVFQDRVSEFLGKKENQLNEMFILSQERSEFYGKSVAVVCSHDSVDDLSTSIIVGQLLEEAGAQVYMGSFEQINFDLNNMSQPLFIDGVDAPVDFLYMLMPWEEMVSGDKGILMYYDSWGGSVKFLEPAWRWFLSHKGSMALLSLKGLDKYIPKTRFAEIEGDWISKPVVGRFSSDIDISVGGVKTKSEGGCYNKEPKIYQEFSPSAVIGDKRVIAGIWTFGAEVAGLAFRETSCYNSVNEETREEWAAHVIVQEDL